MKKQQIKETKFCLLQIMKKTDDTKMDNLRWMLNGELGLHLNLYVFIISVFI